MINIKRNPYLADYEEQRRRKAKRIQRKRKARRQRIMMAGIAGIALICFLWLFTYDSSKATMQENRKPQAADNGEKKQEQIKETLIQGISAEKFEKHPQWEENFLTPNEYSRPGEALPEVKDIFVHYTANPGTSAAQNRSYFEQQKDMHQASVSAHFIIGYEGEIVQCLPLNEIGYAVQTRNYDSVSIECCYKAKDGSFTKETYDSLISLLAWLTDVYRLDTDHILRHYDCGGKKCPLYYTEHEDAWERLKKDVAETL